MKSPDELRAVLRRQWESASHREARLLDASQAWPVVMSIGRPPAAMVATDLDQVKRHVEAWRQVRVGEVIWEPISYRATTTPVDIPTQWKLRKPSEWPDACADATMRQEFDALAVLVEQTDPIFHSLLVRRRSLWRGLPRAAVVQAARVGLKLTPGYAQGRPLRTLAIDGIDTKFFERHEGLLTTLLDVRFDGEVSRQGLVTFLGALAEGEHWLLVVDLDGTLLPFQQQQVRASELREVVLPGSRLLIVENQRCQYQLPPLSDAVAVLGAGFDLGWAEAYRGKDKPIAYWGDLDTWGLALLATARQAVDRLQPLMMSSEVYDKFKQYAVVEPVAADRRPPVGLTASEQILYQRLLSEPCGRLEQEFLPAEFVAASVQDWANR